MFRKISLVAASAALTFGAIAGSAGVAHAAAPPINATGTANCTAVGKIKASPALTIPATSGLTTVTTKVTISGCTGTSPVLSGKGTFVSTAPTNNCTSLGALHPFASTGTIKWKGTVKVNPSTVHFSDQSSTLVDPLVSNAPGSGTSTVSGSFSGQHASAHYLLDQHQADLGTACTGKGIKKLSFSGASTFKITLVGP